MHPTSIGPGARRWRADGVLAVVPRASRRAAVAVSVPVALLGALFSPPVATLVAAPFAAAAAALQAAVVCPGFPDEVTARRAVVLVGAGGGLVVPYVLGAAALGPVGVAANVLLLLLGVVALVGWIAELDRRGHDASSAGRDEELLGDLVGGLTTATLLEEWRSTDGAAEAGDPQRRSDALRLRAAVAQELTRRHPAEAGEWLRPGSSAFPDGPPPPR
ncbi:hypothetical protein [Modestobacter sp. SSW1-42]|uniref:hypothetical protein n=1 Tax=Modestobacter sp. SSW1-42 TaxID=596372 RepID=UPI0039867EDC